MNAMRLLGGFFAVAFLVVTIVVAMACCALGSFKMHIESPRIDTRRLIDQVFLNYRYSI